MWQGDTRYVVSREERLELEEKLIDIYARHGKVIEFVSDHWYPHDVAYMEYSPYTKQIWLKCGRFWFEEDNVLPIIAMAHELGHYVDVMEHFNGDSKEYNEVWGTYEVETKAWENAFHILNEIGFTRWNVFLKYTKRCLDSYFNGPPRHYGNIPQPTHNEAFQRIINAMGSH